MTDLFKLQDFKGVSGIYKFTNNINQKVYIGQSIDIYRRYREHIRHAGIRKYPFSQALVKYGINNFNLELLEKVENIDLLNECEDKWISIYKSLDSYYDYNLVARENNRSFMSDELRLKMSEITKNNYIKYPELKTKLSEGIKKFYKNNISPHKGRRFTKEHKDKISMALRGIKRDPESYQKGVETKRLNGNSNTGIKVQQIDIKTKEIIEEFDSINKAAIATKTPRKSISYAINTFNTRKFKNRDYPKAGNFYWKLK